MAPLSAETLDGEPLTFHEWEIEGGYHGPEFCDTGELGIVSNDDRGAADYPGFESFGDLRYSAGVGVQSYVGPVGESEPTLQRYYDVPWKAVSYQAVYAPPSPDITGPVLELKTPIDCQTFEVGQEVSADYGCDDVLGVGVETCTGTVEDGARWTLPPGVMRSP